MKIDELKKALRNIIREEVKKAVTEEVSKAMGKVLVEMVKEIKSNDSPQRLIKESVEEVEAPVLKTNNPKLNGVLAETARHFKPMPRTSDMSNSFAELMEGGFDKVGANEDMGFAEQPEVPATKMDFLKQMVAQSAPPSQPSALDGGSEVPDFLKKVFKKDFRAVMKRIDEQKQNGGGGYIDPRSVISG